MGVNVYYSPKRKRKYVRRFDYYEAQERYRRGESAEDLAKEFGVTVSRVYQVVTPGMLQKLADYHKEYSARGRCQRCGGQTNLHSQKRTNGSKLCPRCAADDQITTVRPTELRCGHCKQWLPDEAFGLYKSAKPHHRGRHNQCKKCAADIRRERRHRAFAEGRARNLS